MFGQLGRRGTGFMRPVKKSNMSSDEREMGKVK